MLSGAFRLVIGIIFGILCVMALLPGIAAFHVDESNVATGVMFAIVALVAILTTFAPNIRRAFGRGFLLLGSCLLFLPISAVMLSGRAATETLSTVATDEQAFAAVGAGIAGVAITGAATFFGLIVGSIFVL